MLSIGTFILPARYMQLLLHCVDSRGAMPVQGPPGTENNTNSEKLLTFLVGRYVHLSWRIVVHMTDGMNGIWSALIMVPSVLINDDSGKINKQRRLSSECGDNMRMIYYHCLRTGYEIIHCLSCTDKQSFILQTRKENLTICLEEGEIGDRTSSRALACIS